MSTPLGRTRWKPLLRRTLVCAVVGLALFLLYRRLQHYSIDEIRSAVASLPPYRIGLAAAFTALSYAVLTGYDVLALHHYRIRLPYRETALASFLGFAASFNLGLSLLWGGAARYSVYRSCGLSAVEVAKISVFCSAGVWVGIFTFAAGVFILAPVPLPHFVPLPFDSVAPLGWILLTTAAVLIGWSRRRRVLIRFRGQMIETPSPRVLVAFLTVSAADLLASSLVLFVLLPPSARGVLEFLALFLLVQILAILSHAPAGLGVLDVATIELLGPLWPGPELVAALLVYRVFYFLMPMAAALALFALHGIRPRRRNAGPQPYPQPASEAHADSA